MTQTQQQKPGVCEEKKALGEACIEAARDLMGLERRSMAALIHGGELERFELAVKRARLNMDSAKKRYIFHIRTHGC